MLTNQLETIQQHSPNSLAKEASIHPFAPQELKQTIAQTEINFRNSLITISTLPGSELGQNDINQLEAGLPVIYQETETFMLEGLKDLRNLQGNVNFDPVAYKAEIISEIDPMLDQDPEKRQFQLEQIGISLDGLLAGALSFDEQSFIEKDTKDNILSPELVPVLQPVTVEGPVINPLNSVLSLLTPGNSPAGGRQNQQGNAGDIFEPFHKFTKLKTSGVALSVLTAAVSVINVATTGYGLGNWNFSTPDGKAQVGKFLFDMGIAVVWNASQAVALAFTLEYLKKGTLGKAVNTLRNIKDEPLGTYLNFGLATTMAIMSAILLKGDVIFTAQALQKLGDISLEWGIPLGIIIEIGSQFFAAYGTPIDIRGLTQRLGGMIGNIRLGRNRPQSQPASSGPSRTINTVQSTGNFDPNATRAQIRNIATTLGNQTSNGLRLLKDLDQLDDIRLRSRLSMAQLLSRQTGPTGSGQAQNP
jgi:hypothetical protein